MSTAGRQLPGSDTRPHCYRHPDRETYISCQRCTRPICPDCMTQAAVGFQCPECVREGAAQTPAVRTSFGGRVTSSGSRVTMLLIAINVMVFLIANATGGLQGEFTRRLVLVSDAYAPRHIEGVAQGSYWQLITSTFLHTQLLHFAFNMIGIWIFGSYLESQLGRWRYAGLYLVSGLAGSVGVYWLSNPQVPSLGASGAVFGLFGASLLVLLKQRRDVSQLLMLLGINLVFTFVVPNVSWQAHVGGLAAGLLMGAAFTYAPRSQRVVVHAAAVLGLAAVCLGLVWLRTLALT
ncbi:MAG: rhomboid family intramembrane serine protease [Nocardioidaceae bacterium]